MRSNSCLFLFRTGSIDKLSWLETKDLELIVEVCSRSVFKVFELCLQFVRELIVEVCSRSDFKVGMRVLGVNEGF